MKLALYVFLVSSIRVKEQLELEEIFKDHLVHLKITFNQIRLLRTPSNLSLGVPRDQHPPPLWKTCTNASPASLEKISSLKITPCSLLTFYPGFPCFSIKVRTAVGREGRSELHLPVQELGMGDHLLA